MSRSPYAASQRASQSFQPVVQLNGATMRRLHGRGFSYLFNEESDANRDSTLCILATNKRHERGNITLSFLLIGTLSCS